MKTKEEREKLCKKKNQLRMEALIMERIYLTAVKLMDNQMNPMEAEAQNKNRIHPMEVEATKLMPARTCMEWLVAQAPKAVAPVLKAVAPAPKAVAQAPKAVAPVLEAVAPAPKAVAQAPKSMAPAP